MSGIRGVREGRWPYNKSHRLAKWQVGNVYGEGGELLRGLLQGQSGICEGRQRGGGGMMPCKGWSASGACVMLPWLFNLFTGGVVR